MSRIIAFLYGTIAYVLFLIVFLYAIGFVGNIVVPKSIDSGDAVPFAEALLVNIILLGIFAIQHSVMARRAFKAWWTKIVPAEIERSTFVLFTNAVLALLFWQWRPMTDTVWNVEGTIGATILTVVFWAGWLLVLLSTFLINHFDLFGLHQVYMNLKKRKLSTPSFTTRFLYKYIRHPLLLGFIIGFWATPSMSVGHLVFAVVTTIYMLIAIQLEEKDMVARFGDTYTKYQSEVPMLIPTGRTATSQKNEAPT